VERALRHELVHAYDDTRGHVEPTNCYHHACSEVRAARLSGDCLVQQEARRGNVGNLVSGGRDCVLRRAALAVEQNPMCKGFGGRAVDVVFGRCYVDYEPFVAPIYTMGSVRSEAPAA
jgi:inner membrane protease ATP23